jgi:hypothetical protein
VISFGGAVESFLTLTGPEHSLSTDKGGFFTTLGKATDFEGGFLLLEVLFVFGLNLGFGKTAMEHIMINALPEYAKFEPFYFKDSLHVCGLACGVYPWACATSLCVGCCVDESTCCGNGMITIRNACFLWCCFMVSTATLLFLLVIANVPGCVGPYLFELGVLSVLTWLFIQPLEASLLAMVGFGIDTQASDLAGSGVGEANRFDNPMSGDSSDVESSSPKVSSRRRHNQAPTSQSMELVE